MEHSSLRPESAIERGRAIPIEVDGEVIEAFEGETIAAALLASGRRNFGYSIAGRPRSVYCGIGACFNCLVDIEGEPSVKSCTTAVRAGMKIRTGGLQGQVEKHDDRH
jgi:predicted molibdopterin-dependent oxidoreductase YjgC